ncbi:MAG: prepilin-type N-terminal cleavage/methylation domain-containing protein [Armatimonadetes bacterium]|nr:prepilin-type N-terminal cleavage/methylation domain-containing protein [Armatimonadota bacterium]
MVNRKGFSLIELLVVIGIIAILAAILFPMLGNAREHAKQIRCLQNLKQLGLAFQKYCDDNNGTTPFVGWSNWTPATSNWCGCAWPGSPIVILKNAQLWPYITAAGVFICPSDVGREGRYVPASFPLSYSMNDDICSGFGPGGVLRLPIRFDNLKCKKVGKVMLLLHESRGKPGSTSSEGINDGIFVVSSTTRDIGDKIHYTGTTLLYADFHAKWGSLDAIQKERADGYWKLLP